MTGSDGPGGQVLPRAAEALARGKRRLEDLKSYVYDETEFRDRLPFVLDLLAAVTRLISEESRGRRTTSFSEWWNTLSVQLREEITELRHAELKRFESRTLRDIDVVINALASDFLDRPGQRVNDGDTVVTVTWLFSGGPLDGKPVLPTLEQYLSGLDPILADAESRLSQKP